MLKSIQICVLLVVISGYKKAPSVTALGALFFYGLHNLFKIASQLPVGLLIDDLMLFTYVFALLAERGRPEEGFITTVASEEIINLLDLGNIAAKSQAKGGSVMV